MISSNDNMFCVSECVLNGAGYHHAGVEVSDREAIEQLFTSCQLPVLISTSTLG